MPYFRWHHALATILTITMPVIATAGTIRHDRSDQLYQNLASSNPYEAVGRFNWTSSSGGGLASGTLISTEWVLTAGHVVDDPLATNFQFTVGGQSYGASEVIIHPDWNGNIQSGSDLALVRLDQSIDTVSAAQLYSGNQEVGLTTTVVGFGKTGDGFSGSYLAAGEKRAGQNLIGGLGDVVGYSSQSLMADFDFPDPAATGKGISLDLEYLAAPGDSGGGWFIEDQGTTYLAGVTSFGYAPDGFVDSSYGDIMGATRIGDFLSWINSIVAPTTPGDFDGDGDVDGADLLQWQIGAGADYGPGDLNRWKGDYGSPAASGNISAVPEPKAMLVMLTGILLTTLIRTKADRDRSSAPR